MMEWQFCLAELDEVVIANQGGGWHINWNQTVIKSYTPTMNYDLGRI